MSARTPHHVRPRVRVRSQRKAPGLLASLIALYAAPNAAEARTTQLPPVVVETPKAKAKPKAPTPAPAAVPTPLASDLSKAPASLTVPTTAQAQVIFATVPGAVAIVADTAYKTTTPAMTVKDIVDYVPGIFAQPKWGDDTRLSIRGSGLARNFHLRGAELYLDGMPINTADGFGDFQEIDPTAYRYVEVYKGPNGQRFGGHSLGGVINFITPTGRDADRLSVSADIGSFGFHRLQSSSGGAYGPFDYFVTAAWQETDGFREHSWGESTRASANLGYRLSPDVETRFYINANEVRQRIPGSVLKDVALASPRTPAALNVANDWQRNIDTLHIGNKATIRLAPGTTVEFGVFGLDRHLMHPIFQWLDYTYEDYGAFARLTDVRSIGGFKNRFYAALNLQNGNTDADQYVNTGGHKGALLSSSRNTSGNFTGYVENAFYVLPKLALVAGVQYLDATRKLEDKFLTDGDQSGRADFTAWSPKAGLLWEITPEAQVFANVARSAEAPSFGENSYASASAFDAKLQTATTFEIGTRGRGADYAWDLTAYRMEIDHELMCVAPFGIADFCLVRNADKTVHQGLEIGGGGTIARSMFVHGPTPDKLWFNLAYTYSDFRFDNDATYGSNQLPGAPRHVLRAELLYKHPSGTYMGPNVEWVPQAYYVDSANTLDTEPYVLWGLKAGYAPETSPFSVYVEARNLADTHYIASTGITNVANPAVTNLFEPGTGRSVYAGVKYKW